MKYRITVLAFYLFLSNLSAQEVPEIQNSLLTKITASWCTFCGTWGWDTYEELLEQNKGRAIIIANHYSGDLRNSTATAIANNFNSFGQPLFYLNNTNQNVSSSNKVTKLADIKKQVDDNYEASPIANAGITASLDGNTLNVQTKTKFFKSAEGDFYLGVYIIEDNVINFQASRSATAVHKNVLRGIVGTEPFGIKISSGSVAGGMEIQNEFNTSLNGSWNTDNIKIATILWKKESDKYLFFNGYVFNEWQTTTNTIDNAIEGIQVNIRNSVGQEKFVSVIKTDKTITDMNINLFNSQGQLLTSRSFKNLNIGIHTEDWDTSQFPAGMYLIQFVTSKGKISKRVILP